MLHDPRVLYPKEAEHEGIRSGISLGLISKNRPIGTLHLYSAEPRKFDETEVQVLRSLANQAAVAIENAQLYQQSLEKRRIDRELRVAGRIQEQLLPSNAPTVERLRHRRRQPPVQPGGRGLLRLRPAARREVGHRHRRRGRQGRARRAAHGLRPRRTARAPGECLDPRRGDPPAEREPLPRHAIALSSSRSSAACWSRAA